MKKVWGSIGLIVLSVLLTVTSVAQSPHGKELKISCDACHTAESWEINQDTLAFNHDTMRFGLEGQHAVIDCRACHTTLTFERTPMDCASCHTDMHQGTVGFDCIRCHDSNSWLINNITELHQDISFPLIGAHAIANCFDCHISDTDLRFDLIGTACVSCHRTDFDATTNPDHTAAGYSMECQECHTITAFEWSASGIDHSFFPLTLGHDINDCARCHSGLDYSSASPDCFACHQQDHETSVEPNHIAASLPTDCATCHTTNPDWEPAEFRAHDGQFFPIYSGKHNGEWNQCLDCHANSNDYSEFSCTTCHENPETDEHHDDVNGYSYSSTACLACHPTGDSDGNFDHGKTDFPLTGVHTTTECIACHFAGYTGTPTECVACHDKDYQQSINPNHSALGLSTDCATCHTTEPEWDPAEFPEHDTYYALNGAHAEIASECIKCHNGDYNNTPTTCVGCHLNDYNATTDPSHITAQFSTDCAICHSEQAWQPATFDHDAEYFPIYSGSHEGEWSQCVDCHTNPTNYAEFTCITCHANPETDEEHDDVSGYVYNSPACLACHPTGDGEGFDHNLTAFQLTGAHITTDCISCHANGYTGTPTDCASCHTTDFQQSVNPNHGAIGLSTDCASCHTTQPGWSPASFPDHNDKYLLTGAHTMIATECTACHNGDYTNTPNTCIGCHSADYNQTTDPNHAAEQYPTDCIICHSESAWEPSTFDHALTAFPLTGAHVIVDCASCHSAGYTGTPTECAACHTVEFEQTQNPNHLALGLSTDCASCHTTDPEWDPAAFPNHNEYYVLAGAHAMIATECVLCHNGDYISTPNTCIGCHQSEYDQTTNPSHVAAQFSTDCATCHAENAWVPANFDHDAQYFPIYSGSHEGEWDQCIDCHTNLSNYSEVTCITCHANPETDEEHNGVPGYVYNSPACLACHPTGDGEGFNHNLSAFPLTGAHITTDCISCHANGYTGTPTDCASCHTTDFEQSVNPNHGALGISSDCAMCHTTLPGWNPAAFPVHNEYYALQGAHVPISMECALCHNGDYTNTPNTCVGCHIDNYNQTVDPNHIASQFPTECAVCHSETAWQPASIDHSLTDFPLNGAHVTVDCASCHTTSYTGTPTECVACHINDYNQTVDPNHLASQFPTECAVCHSETVWQPATIDHDQTAFPLTGAHISVDCASCHASGYTGTPTECAACHQTDFNQTTNPNHVVLALSTDCAQCHTTNPEWNPAEFAVHNDYYVLQGAHAAIANECAMCHNGNYNNTPNTCVGCHIDDFNATSDPNHVDSGFPTDCILCHSESVWEPAIFDHSQTDFPLTGAHTSIDCASCHANGYSGTPTECVACHVDDYNATNDPDHAASGYPTECMVCHTTTAWEPATFDHNLTDFPLTGAHIPVDCASCHANGYSGTPTDCAACHQTDFNQSTNPNHVVLGLSTDCAQCHTTNPDWSPAEFDVHNNYYVLQGAHAAIANECASCHNGNYNNTPNTCVGCHLSDYNGTTDPDHEALQYPTDCIICHSETAWEPATFDHNLTAFPLTGAHIPVDCASCHAGGYSGTPTDCAACHQTDFNQSTNPNHVVLGLSTDCVQCHTTNPDWSPAEFDVHNNYYVLQGAHAAIANECASCHNGNYNNTPNTCVGCHLSDYNGTTDPDHEALQYPTDCIICHSETAWEPATFDHNLTDFPLTGAHIPVDCASCHAGGYSGTPTDCAACHQTDFNQSTNPNHVVLGLSTDCAQCHTTNPDWSPAEFDVHNNYYVLQGAHAAIANECASCHNGNYNNTPNTCVGCHLSDYNNTNDPDHQLAQFPTDCAQCHSQNAWEPSTFDHDGMYFPIYSGKHENEWDQCNDCHTNPNDYAVFTCLTCHTLSETNNDHDEVSGYQYNSNACLACHPDGEN